MTVRSPALGTTWQAVRALIAGGQLLTLSTNAPSGIQALAPSAQACEGRQAVLAHCALSDGRFTWLVQAALALMLLAVVVGLVPRVTGPLHVYAALTVQSVLSTRDGGDQAALVFAVLMLPLCLADPRTQAWRGSYRPGDWGFISLLVLRLQVGWIYLEASIAKLGEQTWTDGTAVAYWANGVYFRPVPLFADLIPALASLPAVTLLATYGTVVLELGLAASLLLPPRVRAQLFPLALTFHVLIGVTFGIWSFVLVMIGAASLLLLMPTGGRRLVDLDAGARIGRGRTMQARRSSSTAR